MDLRLKNEKISLVIKASASELATIANLISKGNMTSFVGKDEKNTNKSSVDEVMVADKEPKTRNVNNYEMWLTDVECPFCGVSYTTKERSTNTFTKCRVCHKAIYLKWATEERGVANINGFLFIADEPMKFRSEVSEDIPTNESSLEEIYHYLDERSVDYSRNASKEKLLRLITKIEKTL